MDSCHQHGGWGSLAADIANTEEQFLVTNEIIEQVTSHLASRHQRSDDFQIVLFQIVFGQHALLYMAGHTQLRTDAFLLFIDLTQTLQISLRTPYDKAYQQQAHYDHQQKLRSYPTQLLEYFVFVQDVEHYPVCLATNRVIEQQLLMAVFVLHSHVATLVFIFFQIFERHLQQLIIFACKQVVFPCYKETLIRFVHFLLINHILQPVEREVGFYNSYNLTFTVTNRGTISRDMCLGTFMIKVGLCPVAFPRSQWHGEELRLGIVMVRPSQLHRFYRAVRSADRIRFEQAPTLWKQVRYTSNTATENHRIVLHYLVGLPRQGVRLYQVVSNYPRHIIKHHFHLHQFVADTQVESDILALHHSYGRALDDILTIIIDKSRCQLYQQSRHDDHCQAGV